MRKHAPSQKFVFHVPPEGFAGSQVAFPEGEAHHAARVLRLEAGDLVRVTDGVGGLFSVRLDAIGRKGALGTIVETLDAPRRPDVRLTVAVALLKHAGRYETMLEKVTELGASRIVPLVTERSERGDVKESRSYGVLVAATKQCGSAWLPKLDESTKLDRFLAEPVAGLGFVCHESGDGRLSLAGILRSAAGPRPGDVTVLVGPEGGFTDAEVERALAAGYVAVSLGENRLRTETAAVAATALVILNSDTSR